MAARAKRRRIGRPKGSGLAPEFVRRHRVPVSLTDAELEALESLAHARGLPVAKAAYALLAPALKRARKGTSA